MSFHAEKFRLYWYFQNEEDVSLAIYILCRVAYSPQSNIRTVSNGEIFFVNALKLTVTMLFLARTFLYGRLSLQLTSVTLRVSCEMQKWLKRM